MAKWRTESEKVETNTKPAGSRHWTVTFRVQQNRESFRKKMREGWWEANRLEVCVGRPQDTISWSPPYDLGSRCELNQKPWVEVPGTLDRGGKAQYPRQRNKTKADQPPRGIYSSIPGPSLFAKWWEPWVGDWKGPFWGKVLSQTEDIYILNSRRLPRHLCHPVTAVYYDLAIWKWMC